MPGLALSALLGLGEKTNKQTKNKCQNTNKNK
jgi:hypothetical protein